MKEAKRMHVTPCQSHHVRVMTWRLEANAGDLRGDNGGTCRGGYAERSWLYVPPGVLGPSWAGGPSASVNRIEGVSLVSN